jgi:class 3 adenylate cyclase/DNA-binding CsgD family transcriptional regulator
MVCPVCDAVNPEGSRFCNACGTPLPVAAAADPEPELPEEPVPGPFGGGRYVLDKLLNRSGQRRAYLARDTRLDRSVMLSLLLAEGFDVSARQEASEQARALARLAAHPNITTVFDYGEEDGSLYVVGEYLAGGDLATALASAEGPGLPLRTSLQIAVELSQALAHAHEQGVVHRNLRPASIWLTTSGAPKLGDFGVDPRPAGAGIAGPDADVDAARYLAPEQATGEGMTAASDLYALGAMLYEMLTGRPPFVGQDVLSIASQHISTPPVAPSWHNPQLPPALDPLVLQLLAKEPQERPGAAQVAALVAAIREDVEKTRAAEAASEASVPRLAWGQFVGRHEEMEVARGVLSAAAEGNTGLLMVAGEPGIGKTRFVEELAAYGRLRGFQVLAGRCYADVATPYTPFIEAVRQFVLGEPSDHLRRQLGEGAPDLARLVPEIRDRLPDVMPSRPPDPDEERQRLLDAMTSFLAGAADRAPLLLWLDDLHWSDAQSIRLLKYLARNLSGRRVIIVGTYRDVDLDSQHPLSAALQSLRRERRYERVLLRGLREEEVGQLLQTLLQQEEIPGGDQLVKALYRETEGNPFFVSEIVRHLIETKHLLRTGGAWQTDVTDVEALGIPEGVREVVGRRLSRLSPECQTLLTNASLMGREFDLDVLEAISGLDREALLAALGEALEAQVIVEVRGRANEYGFAHALMAQTLYDQLSLPRKQALHLKLAQALEAMGPPEDLRAFSAIAQHYRLAGAAADPRVTIEYAQRAAEAAAAVFAWEEATSHFETALQTMEDAHIDPAGQAGLLARLGQIAHISGIAHAQGIAYEQRALALYEQLGDERRAAQMHSRLGRSYATFPETLNLPRAASHFRAAEETLTDGGPSLSLALLYASMASAGIWGLKHEDGLAAAGRAMQMAEAMGNEQIWTNTASLSGWHLTLTGRPEEGRRLIERAWDKADAANQAFLAFQTAWIRGGWGVYLRDPVDAETWCERELRNPRNAHAPGRRGILLNMLAWAKVNAGKLDEAREALDRAVDAGFSVSGSHNLALWSGDVETVEEMYEAAATRARAAGNLWDLWGVNHYRGVLHMLLGDWHGSETSLKEALEIASRSRSYLLEFRDRSALALLLAVPARLDEARAHLARCYEIVQEPDEWRGVAGWLELAAGGVASAGGDIETGSRHFQAAVDRFSRYRLPFETAGTYDTWGRYLLSFRERERAIYCFDQAIALYERHGGGERWIEGIRSRRQEALGEQEETEGTSLETVASKVGEDRPDLALHAAPDGTLTLLFSDIEGSTEMNESLGDQRWLEVLRVHNAIVRREVAQHGGFEVKSQGDGFMMAFQSARRALNCALAIQRAFATEQARLGQAVKVRIGLHSGEVIREKDDFFGKNVVLAARIAGIARGGQVLVSALVKELTESSGDFEFSEPVDVNLKGLAGTYSVHAAGRAGETVGPVLEDDYELPDGLTPREADVLRLLANGYANREIAEEMVVSVRTVENHIAQIYGKIGASGRAEVVAYALRHKLIGAS